MINGYPYTDLHELNADWLLAKVTELEGRVKELEDGGGSAVTNLVPSFNSGRKLADFEENGQTAAIYEPIDVLPEVDNAGYHNSLYRGKFLGSSISDEQYAHIADGTFEDMFIGDYWTLPITINGVTNNMDFIIAAFDYWWDIGDTFPQGNNKHHVVLVPRSSLYSAPMNSTNITTGGYGNSEMFITNLGEARTAVNNTFLGHVYSVRRLFTSSTDANGQANATTYYTSDVDLMNEIMVYGTRSWGNNGYEVGCDVEMLPLFRLNAASRNTRASNWLRSVTSNTAFARTGTYGAADYGLASYTYGVRPCFAIY